MSTQQLKGIVVNESLETVYHSKVEFDELNYGTKKGVFTSGKQVYAPVVMWLDALDLLFERLIEGVDLKRVKGVSGACQQHGSVYMNSKAGNVLKELDSSKSLKEQLKDCFAWEMSPNWQDHSTIEQCKQFEDAVGGREELANITGNKAHHRFTGPQILRLKQTQPEAYEQTETIALVSSFLASVLAGQHAPLDISDVCGMNLWDIENQKWNDKLMSLIDNKFTAGVGNYKLQTCSYFEKKYGLKCNVLSFTGDNPGTILSLPLATNDVIVSLGTSTTALVVTQKYVPSPLYHLFTHPVGKGYMGMLCYCNGALAREQVRDNVNEKYGTTGWEKFNELAESTSTNFDQYGFYFPLDEIIPEVKATTQRFGENWEIPDNDALAILESQALSIRNRLAPMIGTSRRVYFVGGGSNNQTICKIFTKVLVPSDGAYTMDLSDACAIGAANRAAFGCNSSEGELWEDFIEKRWGNWCKSVGYEGDDNYQHRLAKFVECEKQL